MSEVAHNTPQEFWQPPTAQVTLVSPGMVEVCDGCGAEFMVGSRFCHACGTARQSHGPVVLSRSWTRYLEFHTIKQGLGISTASLIAFLLGLGCTIAACGIGLIYSVQTFNDFQAVQLYRLQWLVGAGVAFVAGILLKKSH